MYQYADDAVPDEVEIDLTGERHFTKGEIIVRGGKNWKINYITIEKPIDKAQRPTIWLELVDAPVNQRCSKYVVFIYSGERIPDETDFDPHGSLTFKPGDIISRHGVSWKIESTEPQSIDDQKQIPTWYISLSRVVVN